MLARRITLYALSVSAAAVLAYLLLLALRPSARLPAPLHWFGEPGNWATIAITAAIVGSLCAVAYRLRHNPTSATVPVVIVIGLLTTGAVLAFASYWQCRGGDQPAFFTAFEWTTKVITGDVGQQMLGTTPCPPATPAALRVARLAVFVGLSLGVVGVAAAALRLQTDRLRARFSRSVTVVLGPDAEAVSMVTAIAGDTVRSTLVLMTNTPGDAVAQECRSKGARVLQVDYDDPDTMGGKRFWRKLDTLYLLAPDPSTNLARLHTVEEKIAEAGLRRVPLIVRIDDPWLAMAWRAEQFGGSNMYWAGDSVGKYEVTARRLLDQIIESGATRKVLVCGGSQLTLALCGDMSRRKLEHDYHWLEGQHELPAIVLVDPSAARYRDDHEFAEQAGGLDTSRIAVDIVEDIPTEAVLAGLMGAEKGSTAAIFVDSATDPSAVTRLAARLPGLDVYAWDWQANVAGDAVPIVGRLRTFRLGVDLPGGQAHDNWARAAMLIHERYRSSKKEQTPATKPWADLDDFYKESNHRQVRNALWMVEHLAGHTWNTWGGNASDVTPDELDGLSAERQLELLGFRPDAVDAMAQAEFEDWSRYYRRAGWKYGQVRDYTAKRHEKLVRDWQATLSSDELKEAAYKSLAGTLVQLRELGYRSQPKWLPYRRIGAVTARRRWWTWTWTTDSGATMTAKPGDWAVQDVGADAQRSVRNDAFRASYTRDAGRVWKRRGVVLARPAEPGEVIDSLEGRATAAAGDHVVMGDLGEQWIVTGDTLGRTYERTTFVDRLAHLTGRELDSTGRWVEAR